VAEPGDGGPGRSWFAIELTSEHVEPGEFPWPEEPEVVVTVGGPVPDSSQMVHAGPSVLAERFPAQVQLVRRVEERVVLDVQPAELSLWRRVEDQHEAVYELSNYGLTVRRDDEEFMVLFD
jgi:hypothetical protein